MIDDCSVISRRRMEQVKIATVMLKSGTDMKHSMMM